MACYILSICPSTRSPGLYYFEVNPPNHIISAIYFSVYLYKKINFFKNNRNTIIVLQELTIIP